MGTLAESLARRIGDEFRRQESEITRLTARNKELEAECDDLARKVFAAREQMTAEQVTEKIASSENSKEGT